VSEVRLTAESRTEFGKGFARRIRAAGKIPAVLYGHGTDPRHLTLPAREFAKAIKGGANTVLTLALPDGDELALAKSVVRHPLRDYYEHVDLIIVRRGEKVTVEVNVVVEGDAGPDTLVNQESNTIEIESDAMSIPEHLTLSVEGIPAGTQFLASQVPLPDGVTLISDPELLVVNVIPAPTAEDLESEGAGETAEPSAAEESEEAAEGDQAADSESE